MDDVARHTPDTASCDLCGDVVGDEAWFGLEVQRPGRDDGFSDDLGAVFCSQAHAVEWLSHPLPPVVPAEPFEPSWRERLADLLLGAAFMATFGFAAVGITAVIWWIWMR